MKTEMASLRKRLAFAARNLSVQAAGTSLGIVKVRHLQRGSIGLLLLCIVFIGSTVIFLNNVKNPIICTNKQSKNDIGIEILSSVIIAYYGVPLFVGYIF